MKTVKPFSRTDLDFLISQFRSGESGWFCICKPAWGFLMLSHLKKPAPYFPFLSLLCALFAVSCTRPKLESRTDALRASWAPSALSQSECDDLGLAGFKDALEIQLKWLRAAPASNEFTFGPAKFGRDQYLAGLEFLAGLLDGGMEPARFCKEVEANFEFFEVYGEQRWGEILLTSYYEPELPASARKTSALTQPIYRVPTDLVEVAASVLPENQRVSVPLRGRLTQEGGKNRLIPYYTREEIDRTLALKGKQLELAWSDPVDVFFMQIQGSGSLIFPDGKKMRIGYADQNGHPYQPIGRYLIQWIPLEKMTLQTIEEHLRSLPPKISAKILFRNPSYVFFRPLEGAPVSSLGVPVTSGRTLAVDGRYFPKGALTFLEFQKPVFATETDREPKDYKEVSRFAFDQDSGGAIRGGGRADLFWGGGPDAKRNAGVIKHPAHLYYLAPKASFLEARGLFPIHPTSR